jgi:hypothetical protein
LHHYHLRAAVHLGFDFHGVVSVMVVRREFADVIIDDAPVRSGCNMLRNRGTSDDDETVIFRQRVEYCRCGHSYRRGYSAKGICEFP